MIGYLRLMRLPNVFTALADIIAGYFLLRLPGSFSADWSLAALCGASGALYLSGMCFNDVADHELDARERPGRPIPSQQVSLRAAVTVALLLMLVGISLALLVSFQTGQLTSLAIAALLGMFILLYDFVSKGVLLLGPLTLGACRALNLLLGMSGGGDLLFLIKTNPPAEFPLAAALALGLYGASLTAFSAQEEEGQQKQALALGWALCASAILLAGMSGRQEHGWLLLIPLTAFLFHLTRQLVRHGSPAAARNLVRFGVMGICVFDAALLLGNAGLAAWPVALLCIALLAPALLLARWLAQKEA